MGRAQKLKKLRKIEAKKEREERKKKNTKRTLVYSLILVLIAGLIAGSIWLVDYAKSTKIKKVVIETDKGNIELELYPKIAPKTVENFINLIKEGFYDGTSFHRVVPDFVIQGGDPLSKDDDPSNDGTGGPGYTFNNEINPIALDLTLKKTKELESAGYTFTPELESIPHEPGVVSMANSGPGTNGSQFFIVISQKDQPHLNGKHTAFGRVYKGMDIARSIEEGDVMNKVYLQK